jgi:hypothetical protein
MSVIASRNHSAMTPVYARVPVDLVERARNIAADEQRSLSGLLHRALHVYVAEHESDQRQAAA